MFIEGKPILHIVDEATHFTAATWLDNSTSKEIWKSLLQCWTHIYIGPPYFLRVDQCSNFVSKEFKGLTDTAGIKLVEAPIEYPSTMSHVERYHGPLRKAYTKLKENLSGEGKQFILQMAVYAVNNTIGPEGLCPSLCVFGAIPKPLRTSIATGQLSRAKAIDAAIEEVQKHHAKKKITLAKKYKGPYGKEQTELDNLEFGSQVLLYRERAKKWVGPVKFIWKIGETVRTTSNRT